MIAKEIRFGKNSPKKWEYTCKCNVSKFRALIWHLQQWVQNWVYVYLTKYTDTHYGMHPPCLWAIILCIPSYCVYAYTYSGGERQRCILHEAQLHPSHWQKSVSTICSHSSNCLCKCVGTQCLTYLQCECFIWYTASFKISLVGTWKLLMKAQCW